MSKLKLRAQFFKLTKENRLYGLDIALIGLTGSIATGKSSATQYLKSIGHPVIDADKLVKDIYSKDESIKFIQSIQPSLISGRTINFIKLRELFFNDQDVKFKVESYIYSKLEAQFREEISSTNITNYIIYDIPLLFEKNLESNFDLTICVHSSPEIQIQRLMLRDKINKELAQNIISSQINIDTKKFKSDLVIDNNENIKTLHEKIDSLSKTIFI